DLASAHHTSLDSLFNGTDFNGASLASLGAATSTLRDNGIDEVELNVGNNDAAHTVHLSDDNAHALLDAGLSFVEGNHVTVDAHSTHLNNSLKDLEKLHVDAV
ncbi:hypothetical protein, partial [Polynucleobacter alcilacus]|uniref:hypothetical protein n=1 Tax=Polynucleobacter alcilacus TaxID=1819739 RepID=UPI001C0A9FB8